MARNSSDLILTWRCCINANYIQNTSEPPFHVGEYRLWLLFWGVEMNGFDPVAICIICDSSDVVFRIPSAFVVALTITIVRRKLKEWRRLGSTHREMSFLVFGGKDFVLFSAASLRAGPCDAATSEGLVHSVVSVATSQAISTPNLTILPTGIAFLITFPDILICDEGV